MSPATLQNAGSRRGHNFESRGPWLVESSFEWCLGLKVPVVYAPHLAGMLRSCGVTYVQLAATFGGRSFWAYLDLPKKIEGRFHFRWDPTILSTYVMIAWCWVYAS